jgi:hypothetical protein
MNKSIRKMANVLLLAMGSVMHLNAFAKDDVIIGGITYEELDRKELKNGDIMVQLRVKAKEPVGPDAATPPKNKADSAPQKAAADLPKSIASLTPKLDQAYLDALAKEAQSNDSPGLTTLGVTAGDMNTPVSPKDFAAMVAKGADASGKIKEGVAVQFSPASLFFPNTIIGGNVYEKSRAMQAWARTSMELATSKSDDARIGQQVAGSLTVGLVDGSDPRLFWAPLSDCANKGIVSGGLPSGPIMTDAEQKAFDGKQEAALELALKCHADYQAEHEKTIAAMWSKPRWYAGYSRAWSTGTGNKIVHTGTGPSMFWSSYSQGLSNQGATTKALLQVSASRKWHLQVNDAVDETKLVDENRTDLMMRLRFSRQRWSGFADYGVARVTTDGVFSSHVRRFGYGAEYKLSDTMWLVLGSITERGFVTGEKRTLLNTGLRFGQTDKPVFRQPDK